MDILKLKSRQRSGKGKSYTRKVRNLGWVPAIFYGQGKEPVTIEIDKREFAALVRNRKLTHLIDLSLSGMESDSIAVIREVQRHVIKDDLFFHVDFQHVDMTKKVTVDCPVELEGIATGVKESGGILGHPIRSVKIECMPMDIPEKIIIDVTRLDVGQSIHVRDVTNPKWVIKESEDEVLAVVTLPTREDAPAAADAATPAAGAAAAPAAGAKAAPAAGAKAAPAAGAKAAPAPAKGKEKGK